MYNKINKAAEVIDSYLTCYDFNSRVILTLEDGSKFHINYAFYIKLVDYIVVFSEHNGIFIKHKNVVESVRQYKY